MNCWKKLYWGLLLLTSLSVTSAESASPVKRRITLSLGYDENFNSSKYANKLDELTGPTTIDIDSPLVSQGPAIMHCR